MNDRKWWESENWTRVREPLRLPDTNGWYAVIWAYRDADWPPIAYFHNGVWYESKDMEDPGSELATESVMYWTALPELPRQVRYRD